MSSHARRPLFSNTSCNIEGGKDGTFVVRSALSEGTYPPSVFDALEDYALASNDNLLFRESARDAIVNEVTVGEAWRMARRVGRTLLELGASNERPVVLVSENSIRAAVLILGCYAVGVPVAPISPSYSKLSKDYSKLRYILGLLTPSVIVFDEADAHLGAIAAVPLKGVNIAVLEGALRGASSWTDLLGSNAPTLPVQCKPTDVAKILFTSGSTGNPKGVINTQRMMMSNQFALAQVWPGIFARPPRLVDWLPWNHTYGGNQIFNMPIVFGGSLTIDRGRPTLDGISTMVASIKRTKPTIFLNVPRALGMLADCLEQDTEFAEAMFEDLDLIGFAGAALPVPISDKIKEVGIRIKGAEVPIVGLWGSTETAPVVTAVHFPSEVAANIGLPIPGFQLKFAPVGTKLELRVKGTGVTPGYWRQPEATKAAFDEDGFLRMGDAGRLVDQDNIAAGILFDGRTAENFKLLSGTWVNVGLLRVQIIAACMEDIADVVIAGHDRDEVCALIFPKIVKARDESSMDSGGYVVGSTAQDRIRTALRIHNANAGGSSNRIARAIVLSDPPSVDAGEITDKGYINQRAVLDRRAHLVDLLYSKQPCDGVIVIEGQSHGGDRIAV